MTKKKIRTWLEHNKIPCNDDCLKVELAEILKKIALEKAFKKVTKQTCQRTIQKVRRMEDVFWKEDANLDQNQNDPSV